jgi:hypothetical protein
MYFYNICIVLFHTKIVQERKIKALLAGLNPLVNRLRAHPLSLAYKPRN